MKNRKKEGNKRKKRKEKKKERKYNTFSILIMIPEWNEKYTQC